MPLYAGQVAQRVGWVFGGFEQRFHRAALHGHAAQQAFAGRVGACHVHVVIGDEDAVQAGLEDPRSQFQARLGLGLGRDVAEGENAPHGQAPAQLGHGAALQNAAVAQVQYVGRFHQGLGRQQLQLLRVGLGIAHLAGQVIEDGRVVAAHQQRLGNSPERGESVVEGADAAIGIAHQDGVGRRLQRGAQLAQQAFEFGLVQRLLAPVQHADQEHLAVERAHAHLHGRQLAVGTAHLGNELGAGLPVERVAPERLLLRRGGQHLHGQSHGGIGLIAGDGFAGGVGAQHLQAAGIDQPQRLLQGIEQAGPGAVERLLVQDATFGGSNSTARSK